MTQWDLYGTYRCASLVGPRRTALATASLPVCRPRQVLVRVHYVGVCASELPAWQAGPDGGRLVLGHEPAGYVVAVGPGVTSCAVGDLVAGRIAHSFAEYAVADEQDVVVVPAGVPAGAAAVGGEPLGCVVEGLRRTSIDVADRVAVIGTGFMGLCLVQLLVQCPTSRLVAIDPRADAREQALRRGADEVYHPTDGRGEEFDVVFETSGSQAGLDLATELVAPHRTLSILGYHQQSRTVDMRTWNYRAITVVNAHVRDRDRLRDSTRRGLDLVAAGRIDVAGLITHRYPLADLDQAFTALVEKPDGFVKAVVDVAP
jgi:2-desacetyl-2-hydroxyethyl bacteriochlorophyllide A dehydrogenase